MSNIEKIRQEIERLKEENRNIRCQHNEKYCTGYDDAFNDLLTFIDSLPKEKEVIMLNESVKAETIVPLSIMDETIEDAAPMLVKQQLAQAVGRRLLQEGFLDFDVQKFDYNRIRVRCVLSLTMIKNN